MAYLDSTERELTLTEFMAVMVFNEREYVRIMVEMVREMRNAGEHSEAVLGAIDELAQRIAASSGLPYAASYDERAAMASRWRQAGRETALPGRACPDVGAADVRGAAPRAERVERGRNGA